MFQLKPRIMERQPGDPNVVVLMADRSTSMPSTARDEIDETIPGFQAAYPGLRLFGFHSEVLEVKAGRHPDRMRYCYPPCHRASSEKGAHYRNATYHGVSLEQIARLNPSLTIILSDGGGADKQHALQVADRMTGSIDAYYCDAINSAWQDRRFMEEVARRGRGKFVPFTPGCGQLEVKIRQSIQRIVEVHHHRGETRHVHHDREHHAMQRAPSRVRIIRR
jgi:hypothetical protein